ncbi:MAG TPA: hypothetical protein VGP93_08585, partial [Polyangiaceae bacterium]|nr:hypothetical protein [Polyangiaceae bacterium]
MPKSFQASCALALFVCSSGCGASPNPSEPGASGGAGQTGQSAASGGSANAGTGASSGSSASAGSSGKGGGATGGTAGGGSATGGSGGTGNSGSGGTPPEVLPCDSLPGAGQWENISPDGLSDTTALIADPFEAGTVWLGTTDGGLFKSTDCGAQFTHISTGRGA